MDRETLGSQVPLELSGTCEPERLSIHVPAAGRRPTAGHGTLALCELCVKSPQCSPRPLLSRSPSPRLSRPLRPLTPTLRHLPASATGESLDSTPRTSARRARRRTPGALAGRQRG